MTAGSGIIHQEMPKGDPAGRMHGFQLWANLPSSLKMTPPRYQEVKALDIPIVTDDDGTHVRIVCGSFWGKRGPVDGIATDPIYLDVSVPPASERHFRLRPRATASPTSSPGRENSAMPRARSPFPPKASDGWILRLPPRPATARSFCSTAATKLLCRLATTASASCWFPVSRCRSPSRGTGPSS